MGVMTNDQIEAWQKQAGLEPATGSYALALEKLSQTAFDLIKVIELEKSGIRDGDGCWHGSDVVGHVMGETIDLCKRVLELSPTGAHDVATDNERLAVRAGYPNAISRQLEEATSDFDDGIPRSF